MCFVQVINMSTGKGYKVNVLFKSSICLQERDIR